ncbi:putative membrane protein [Algoriphagus boseongensis]|uniref:Putative membrane protein n=1 Tax=Algoriphagus boseongensis TaxID=1442587 RepID=A0A4R6T5H8_9BACT|nr:c-type cytochrome domain-containing protein [Algoriphagus boseongensis]TDQ18338.1 putative membrane protein [Algoriphagus boseongensis]
MFDFIFQLFGRFHPLLVHLPIGILLFGIILVFLSKSDKTAYFDSIRLAFLLGGISALASSASGFLQYQNEGFAWDSVQFHFYFGLVTTVTSFWLFFELKNKQVLPFNFKLKSSGLTVLLLITGHLGGNITHGEEYLTEVLPEGIQNLLGVEEPDKGLSISPQNWEQLRYYEGVVQPILNSNCKSCHNPRNSKGDLDLSSYESLLAGGENGPAIHSSDFEKSELYARLNLPLDHEDHMPPQEKRQPKKEEVELIRLWIVNGASTTQTLGEAKVEQKLLEPFFIKEEKAFYPEITLKEVSPDTLQNLKAIGFYSEPVFQGSPFLKVTCINFKTFSDEDLKSLNGVKDNLAYLDLSGTQISDEVLNDLSLFPNLTVLKLNETKISGENLAKLKANTYLKHLYLNGTQVSAIQLEVLNELKSLEKVYAFNTPITEAQDRKKFKFSLEIGGYTLPPIPSDTIVY